MFYKKIVKLSLSLSLSLSRKKIKTFFSSRAGFTLIELLVVITILSILATVVLLVINPAQMFKQSRDATRISDMETISKAILVFQSSGTSALSMGSSNTIYVSVPSASAPLCTDLNLSAPPSGWAHACSTSANNRKTNGTGWIPIDFSSSPFGSLLATLPIDPANATSTGLYYTYINGSFALSATMESTKYLASTAANDKGQSSTRFELGSNLALNVNLLAAATAPTNIVLAIGSTAPVGGVTNVAIPAAGATDTTGAVTGWVTSTADKIIFTVTDGGSAVSTITIGGAAYTSGANYTIPSTSNLSIIVTTTESGKTTGTRTFTVTVAAGFAATGGTITTSGGYRIHTFTSSGTFTPNIAGNVEVLVVAGGGGGGAGGGGAGGVISNSSYAVTAQGYTVTVNNGGAGSSDSNGISGTNGGNSSFAALSAIGGGGGAHNATNGLNGGSGGGSGYSGASTFVGGSATSGQGNAGGGNAGFIGVEYPAGGGGGAGGVGGNATSNSNAGSGGAGITSSISGSSTNYAGGGGGGLYNVGGTPGTATYGGGNGNYGPGAGSNGTANTGGGGGGSGSGGTGGTGGSGIVIIRYPL